MTKRFLTFRRCGSLWAPSLVAALLTGCGAGQPANTPQAALPASNTQAVAPRVQTPQPAAAMPPPAVTSSARVQWRYQCPSPKGGEWLVATYHGQSPETATALTLQRGESQTQFNRARLPGNPVFLANDERNDYRWLLEANGSGSLRVRAPNRTAVETPVLTGCQPVQS
ncbi:hypothetical protein E8K88_13135 [Lampropedia aestuarii]|uniref:C-type lysozyme inhibitor domain-containing protein n=1 Tax=Lampropedia aestuarii TaxID=2562762 RepID=A0A4S5BIE1_9BURK|nr:hypothetical protein [Lampropedia aestuarii]THJ32184.1 hypothetical protein E8K88_13135 [Lampropedia aestuarii]